LHGEISPKKADITGGEKFRWSIQVILEGKKLCDRLHPVWINIQREKQPSKDKVQLIDKETNKRGIFQNKRKQGNQKRYQRQQPNSDEKRKQKEQKWSNSKSWEFPYNQENNHPTECSDH
jgi:hypothetical protein